MLKFARRKAVAAAGVLAVLFLIATSILGALYGLYADQQRRTTQKELAKHIRLEQVREQVPQLFLHSLQAETVAKARGIYSAAQVRELIDNEPTLADLRPQVLAALAKAQENVTNLVQRGQHEMDYKTGAGYRNSALFYQSGATGVPAAENVVKTRIAASCLEAVRAAGGPGPRLRGATEGPLLQARAEAGDHR